MEKLFIILAFIVGLSGVSFAQDIVGDWHGSLKVGEAELRLVLHVTKADDGSLNATLDSIDQGAPGIPVSAVTLKDSKLDLTVEAVHGTYAGKVNADASEIDGTWTQGAPLELNFHRGGIPAKALKPAKASDIDGDWLGTLDTGMGKLRLLLHLANTEAGLTATMDSLDQGANGLPVTSITRTGASLKFEMKGIGGAYDGTISADLGTFIGTWTQAGKSWPLAFQRVKNVFYSYSPLTGVAATTESGEAVSLSRGGGGFVQQPGSSGRTGGDADDSAGQGTVSGGATDGWLRAA